ncbi:unnamed protein product [Taenia asiatica]|uniref:Uncharacterized protein n=1 Tax=Taenia asiatica TaxID=60517 RepID=A0A3P6PIM7_TAEAS|nr:unnamed protein product [Taenia asiatica]
MSSILPFQCVRYEIDEADQTTTEAREAIGAYNRGRHRLHALDKQLGDMALEKVALAATQALARNSEQARRDHSVVHVEGTGDPEGGEQCLPLAWLCYRSSNEGKPERTLLNSVGRFDKGEGIWWPHRECGLSLTKGVPISESCYL